MNNSFLFFSDFNTETSNTSQLNSENPDSGKPLWREIFEKSQLIMTCFGIVANIATIITLMFNGREFSPAIGFLLKHQSFIDALVCLFTAILMVAKPMWVPGKIQRKDG